MQSHQKAYGKRIKLTDHHDDRSSTTINDLDFATLADILSRLPIESILACKRVSTKWYYVTADRLFIKNQLSRASNRLLLLPVLGKEANFPGYYPLLDAYHQTIKRLPISKIPISGYHKIKCSFNGLLCVASPNRKADPLFVVNPITSEHVTLPSTKGTDKCQINQYVVSLGCNDSGLYKIARYYRFRRRTKESKLEILSLGKNKWSQIDTPLNNLKILHSTFCGGYFFFVFAHLDVYWKVTIIAVDFETERIQIVPFNNLFHQYPSTYVEIADIGEGFISLVERKDKRMRVWKMCGKTIGELELKLCYDMNTRIQWGHWFYFRALGQLDENIYLLWYTLYRQTDRMRFAVFKPGAKPACLVYPIAELPCTFAPMWFKPSFVRPVAALLGV